MNAKVKVSVLKLIEAVEARKQEAEREADQRIAKYPETLEKWKRESLSKLVLWKELVEHGNDLPHGQYGGRDALPQHPTEPPKFNSSDYDRTLATLRMATDDSIAITAEDYGRYVR